MVPPSHAVTLLTVSALSSPRLESAGIFKLQPSARCCHLCERCWPLRLADQNSGPLAHGRLSRVRAYVKSYSSPGSFTACLFTVVFFSIFAVFAYLSAINVIQSSFMSAEFLCPFPTFFAGECKVSGTSSFTPSLLGTFLSYSSSAWRRSHSNRPSTGLSVGLPPLILNIRTTLLQRFVSKIPSQRSGLKDLQARRKT